MKRFIIFIIVFGLFFSVTSCKEKKGNENKLILTERIQYPVFIKSPYEEETDWWCENMEGPKREKFVDIILDAALSGKVKAYNYMTNDLLSKKQVEEIFNRSDTLMVTRTIPPFEEYDTVINTKLDRRLIHRITFLEEWYFDEENFIMEKKVVGIAPAITSYSDSSEILGYKPLFWVYLDEKYPLKK
jgi:hypothetical protein